jgi:hypothetical protein
VPILKNFTFAILLKMEQQFFLNKTCIHLAFVNFHNTTLFYLDGNLIDKNIQFFNLNSLINNIIYNYFKVKQYTFNYDIKKYNFTLNSDQISNDFTTFKSNCTYCNLINKNISINSGRFKFLLLNFKSSLFYFYKNLFLYNLKVFNYLSICNNNFTLQNKLTLNLEPILEYFTVIIMIKMKHQLSLNTTCIHLSIVYYFNTITKAYLNGILMDENFQFYNLNSIVYSQFDYLDKILTNHVKVLNVTMNNDQILDDYDLFKRNCIYSTHSLIKFNSRHNSNDLILTDSGKGRIKKRSTSDCTSQCSNYCTTTCTSKCTLTTARLSDENFLKLSNTSCSCVCDCACYSPPISTTTITTLATSTLDIILFPFDISEANQGNLFY